jgi:ABC-type multidrug transport system fused ATPase/permease subunit
MEFFRVYGRVIGLLRAERGLAIGLALANIAVAALQFYEPVLFGKVVDLLSNARNKPESELWSEAVDLLLLWAAVGLGGLAANIVVSLQADRMAHRRRLGAMATFFEHVLVLPFAFHHGQHSGRLLKVMLTGVDHLFGIWLSFFRENLATFVALFVMLPLSLFMNWRLGLLLIVLIVFFAISSSGSKTATASSRAAPATRWATSISSRVSCGWAPRRARCTASCARRWRRSFLC